MTLSPRILVLRKIQRSCEGAATRLPLPVRELMALNRNEISSAVGRQAIFLGTTGPRAARPGKAPPRGD
jgi:hypothetical protein